MELAIAGTLVVVMLFAGFRMEPLLAMVEPPLKLLAQVYGHG
jgi:hypothetical protein